MAPVWAMRACRRDDFSGVGRSARRCVKLVGMVQFDNLDRLKQGRRFPSKPHEQAPLPVRSSGR